MEREKEILTDLGTVAQLILHANRQSTHGLSKFIEKPDSEIMEDVALFRFTTIKELEKVLGADFRRKALE